MGHSGQTISLLVQGAAGHVAAVPLMSRIHEGLVFSNRDSRTLLDELAVLMFSIANFLDRKILLLADASYASGKLIPHRGTIFSALQLRSLKSSTMA